MNSNGFLAEATRSALRDLAVSLARSPEVVDFARELADGSAASDRLGRLTTLFTFVAHLVDVPPPVEAEPRDGIDVLMALAGEHEGPAVILTALLQALGERAAIDYVSGLAFVRVELDLDDVARLPPHAGLIQARGRCYLPLDARGARHPLGFLPREAREALSGNRRF